MSKTISTFHHDVIGPAGLTFFNDGPTTRGIDHADVLPTVDKSSAAYREGYEAAMASYAAEANLRDAVVAEANAEAAWAKSVNDLNAWRNEVQAQAAAAPVDHPPAHTTPKLWDTLPASAAVPRRGDSASMAADAAAAERAYQQSVNALNAWRNEQ